MELSIIIVNWNSVELLRQCLRSIWSSPPAVSFEVLVIDNASYDGSADLVSRHFPSVIFIQSDKNLGFAGGNNVAFQRCCGKNVLFLNPDTEVVGDALATLLSTFRIHPEAGIVGPKLVNPDLSVQIDCMRAFPTILNQMIDSSLSRRMLGRFNFAGLNPVIEDRKEPMSVEMLPGTCVMLRREVFEKAGRFSERYFMYAEDVELSYRVKDSGLANYYVANAVVIHHGASSSAQKAESFFSTVMMREAVWEFFRASRGDWYASSYRGTTCLAALARLAVLSVARLLRADPEARYQMAASKRKWIKVLRWSVGLESWAHGYKPSSIRSDRMLTV